MFFRPNPALPCRIGPNHNFPDFQSFLYRELHRKRYDLQASQPDTTQLGNTCSHIMLFSGRCIMQHADIVLAKPKTTGRISQLHAHIPQTYTFHTPHFFPVATTIHLSSDRQFKFHGAAQTPRSVLTHRILWENYNWIRLISSKVNGRIRHFPSPSIKIKLTD